MISSHLYKYITNEDSKYVNSNKQQFIMPVYNPTRHYVDLGTSKYYEGLIILRHVIKRVTDEYFSDLVGAKNIDLFMLTPCVSSPTGPGSDSEPIPIKFGELNSFLVDSSQFGFEPILMSDIRKVYCYLPSLRGENPDSRHLNQFFHCEAEIAGQLSEVIILVEEYVRILSEALLLLPNLIEMLSTNPDRTIVALRSIINIETFPTITFDEAVKMLESAGKQKLINYTDHGKDISVDGEKQLLKILGTDKPVWVTGFDRDRIPFYQKPDPLNYNKAINADLLFPPLTNHSFGGEIVGAGQRQDTAKQIRESLQRQNISTAPYEWYIHLRELETYVPSSGFGLGIERFITWALARNDIKDVIPYPRLKNIMTYP